MKRTALALSIAASLAAPAWAGEEPVVVFSKELLAAAGQADAWGKWAEDFSREMRASMGSLYGARMGSHKVVKGAPYSAEVITEVSQSLADGNTISRRKSGTIHRDSEGRTRQETAADGKSPSIHINDPVEGKMYILSPGFKKAIVVPSFHKHEPKHEHRHKQVVRADGREIRVEDGKVFIDGKEVATDAPEVTTRSGKKILVKDGKVLIDGREVAHVEGSGTTVNVHRLAGPDGKAREEVRVRVVRSGDDKSIPVPPVPPAPPVPGVLPVPPMPGVQTMRFESTARLGKGVTTPLGMKEFDGVRAEGKSTVWTIPAGEIGNKNPISITSETWYSPDLQVTVHSRYNDPRTGETVYRLANIRRGEPPADLFRVPEGFETKSRGRS